MASSINRLLRLHSKNVRRTLPHRNLSPKNAPVMFPAIERRVSGQLRAWVSQLVRGAAPPIKNLSPPSEPPAYFPRPSGEGLAREALRRARTGQPDPGHHARFRTRRTAGPHGVRNPCAEHPASLSDRARDPVLRLSRSGSVPRLQMPRPSRGTRPLRALLMVPATPLRGAGRRHMPVASFFEISGASDSVPRVGAMRGASQIVRQCPRQEPCTPGTK